MAAAAPPYGKKSGGRRRAGYSKDGRGRRQGTSAAAARAVARWRPLPSENTWGVRCRAWYDTAAAAAIKEHMRRPPPRMMWHNGAAAVGEPVLRPPLVRLVGGCKVTSTEADAARHVARRQPPPRVLRRGCGCHRKGARAAAAAAHIVARRRPPRCKQQVWRRPPAVKK